MAGTAAFTDLDAHGSFTWIAHTDQWMQRASAALVVDGGVYVVDPVDTPDLDARLAERGPVLGVLRLLNRHGRDGAAVAARHGVDLVVAYEVTEPVHPDLMVIPVAAFPGWREVAVWMPGRRVLVVAEAVGTVEYFLARDGDPLGVHPLIRAVPPRRALGGIDPVALAVGHGPSLHAADAGETMRRVLAGARRDLPRAWMRAARLARRARRS